MTTILRDATLASLLDTLRAQEARKIDAVMPFTALRSRDAVINARGVEAKISSEGVTVVDGAYQPSDQFIGQLATRLDVPVGYLRKLRAARTDLFDANVNGLIHGRTVHRAGETTEVHPADGRRVMLRAFAGQDGQPGTARALLSSRYRIMDNLPVLGAALAALQETDPTAYPVQCHLSEDRMFVRIVSPTVTALAPTLLANYRSPFAGQSFDNGGWTLEAGRAAAQREGLAWGDGGEPIVFAGFDIRNSETGRGRLTLIPVVQVQVCKNGLVITEETYGRRHLGAELEDGVVWSDATHRANVELVQAQVRDIVRTVLNPTWLVETVQRIDVAAGRTLSDPANEVVRIVKSLGIGEAHANAVFNHYIQGGQNTIGGVVNALTAYAQTVPDADTAHDIEDAALGALRI